MDSSGRVIRQAGLVGLAVAGAAAALFLAAVASGGGYPPVARFGGAAWVFVLTWIITMPVLAPRLRRRDRA